MSEPSHVYIHVPFCLKKCGYCDFYSIEDTGALPGYVAALCREMTLESLRSPPSLKTLYFGGGTPSLLPLDLLEQILEQVDLCHGLSRETEITMEVNPGTVDPDYLKGIRALGVNRLSMGVQSFDPARLKFLSRIHSPDQAMGAIEGARRAGFDNLGLDLIYGLPGEDAPARRRDLDTALGFAPEHLSCYMLTLEPETPLFQRCEQGAFIGPDPGAQNAAFLEVGDYLTRRGYDHYEISNFARGGEGWYSRHNSAYWRMVPYRGYGPGAHSLEIDDGGRWRRFWNLADLEGYIRSLERGGVPPREMEILSLDQKMIEWIMVGLRTAGGIDTKAFVRELGKGFYGVFSSLVADLIRRGLGQKNKDHFRLTRAGWARLDHIVESFYDQI